MVAYREKLTQVTTGGIYEYLTSKADAKDYRFIICGQIGPTGKTYLCNKLVSSGYKAIELTECLIDFDITLEVSCLEKSNGIAVYEDAKVVLVVLNRRINKTTPKRSGKYPWSYGKEPYSSM